MKLLSEYHKKRIKEGIYSSNKFKKAQQNKDVSGRKNPNWRLKVIYYCPICGKKMKVTKKKRKELVRKNRTCSRKCGAIIISNKMLGRKNPSATQYMKINNPMFNPVSRAKATKTLKKRFLNGELNELKQKLRLSGRKNITKYNKLLSTKKMVAKRMKVNNPMFRTDIRNKVSRTNKLLYKNGDRIPPKLSGSRFKRGYFTDYNNNLHHYDSGWELKRMQFLNQFRTIQWEKADRHFAIPYRFAGTERTYFPDFVITRRGKTLVVEEVGEWSYPKYKKTKKILSAKRIFSSMEVNYVVLSKQSQLQSKTW